MLRVEPSNLIHPRGALRPRRLLPYPPGVQRPGASKARHEMLPPREDDAASEELTVPHGTPLPSERWSVQLELADEEIAKLYGQGMTRGAVVWKKGMVEWRPLLVTQELTGLLRRTRTTLTSSPLPSFAEVPPQLPRPPRVPSSIAPALAVSAVGPASVAPIEMDVEQAPRKARRPVELIAVAVTAFAIAWIAHGAFRRSAPTSPVAALPPTMAAAAAPACETRDAEPVRSVTPSSNIPTIAVADLPLAGAKSSSVVASMGRGGAGSSRSAAPRSNGGGPSRDDLMNALGQVGRSASSCGERGGPVRVVISFASSGVARSIQVSGQDLPAATRSCIIGAASRARIPAFTGEPVTVSKTL